MTVNPRSVDAVTRAAYSRGLPPAIWASLVSQAVQSSGTGREQAQEEVAESVLALLQGPIPPPPVLQYCAHALSASPPLVHPHILARHVVASLDSFSPSTIEALFRTVSSAPASPSKAAHASAGSAEATAEALLAAVEALIPHLVSPSQSAPEAAAYLARLLSDPPHQLTHKTLAGRPDLLKSCVQALQNALKATDASSSTRQAELAALRLALERRLGRLGTGGRRRQPAKENVDNPERPLVHEADALVFASTFLSHPLMPTASLATRLSSFCSYRLAQAPFHTSTPVEALSRALADTLFVLLDRAASVKKEDLLVDGLVFGKLPLVLHSVSQAGIAEHAGAFQEALVAALRLVQAGQAPAASTNAMDVDQPPTSAVFDKLITSLCQQSLITPDEGASLTSTVDRGELEPVQLPDYLSRLSSNDPDELAHLLHELETPSSQRSISHAIRDHLADLATSPQVDLFTLAHLCESLAAKRETLEVVFLYVEPKEVLSPLRSVLDGFEAGEGQGEEYGGENNPTERYGALVLFVQVVVNRFQLCDNLAYHLGSTTSFFTSFLPSSTATYALSVMSDDERAAVSGWIAALFGEGISDDLMHATNPRTLLRVAPTILKQSLMACHAGVVDLDVLRDALSYFLQELLQFTLPGALGWLIEEVERTPPSTARAAMLDILQTLVFSPELPAPVLELLAPDLAGLLAALPEAEGDAIKLDRTKVRELIRPYRPRRESVRWQEEKASTSAATLTAALTSVVNPTSTSLAPPNLASLLSRSLAPPVSPSTFLRSTLLPPFLSLATSSPTDTALYARLERAGAAALAFSPPASSSAPLVVALMDEIVVPALPAWAARRLPNGTGASGPGAGAGGGGEGTSAEPRRLELVADVLGGALVALLSVNSQPSAQVERSLARVEEAAVLAIKAAQWRRRPEEKEEEEDDAPSALSVFLDRLLSWEGVRARCSRLVELSGGEH
ncbi:hypothetical protein JCM10207_001566 [Rhodosporidiobolus poonsookiae]